MSGDRIGLAGLFLRYVALRDVLRGGLRGGLRGAFRPSFFLLRAVFSWWVMSGDEYFLLSGE
ncbi:hypothetical protein [Escherichia coli]|uniref:hypothetical protein n=1 Tax=Escherichia coli TaxID=562 RepID=UPI001CD98BAE|nr:hypothetical protein [Escherichia coli]MCA2040378.1 hypothetical protein [Escherichia coli]